MTGHRGISSKTVSFTIRVPVAIDRELERICAKRRGLSKNKMIVAALAGHLFPDDADKKELALNRFLERIERRLKANDRNIEILAETISLYVRVWLTNTIAIAEDQKDEARRIGGKRFRNFVEQLTRRLQEGKSLFAELPEEVLLKPEAFFVAPTEEKGEGETL